MPAEILPIYQIQDFTRPVLARKDFYLNRFEAHIQTHDFVQKPHKHDFYILLFFTSGTGTHTIDFINYEVQPGTAFFLSPGQVHSWQLSADTKGFTLFFSTEFYLTGKAESSMFRYPFFNALNQQAGYFLNEKEAEKTAQKFEEIESEYLEKGWKKDTMLRNYLENLLIYFTRLVLQNQYLEKEKTAQFSALQHLEDLIDLHFRSHQPVTYYAEKLNITVKQLNETTKKALGKTAAELIQSRLILEAKRLLTHSGLTISQVAAELGFFDNSYFSRFFKKRTNQTPEQFRQQVL